MCVHPPGRRCYCYQQHLLEVAYDDTVYSANDVGLKAHSHRDYINEVSCQFTAMLVFVSTIHLSRGDVNGL